VEFLVVYISEAHAFDGASPRGGRDGNPIVEEPITIDERLAVATVCRERLDLSPMTVLIDDMQNTADRAYAGFPDRLYLVGKDGRIAYAGDPGPIGFRPDELEAAVRVELGLPPLPEPEPPAEDEGPAEGDRRRGGGEEPR
jgi:hypothetical protein